MTDTSVLINFLVIDRTDLLAGLSSSFAITDHVVTEIADHYPEQQVRLREALEARVMEQCTVTGEEALSLFGTLQGTHRLGSGESSAIAYAATHGFSLAIDDRRAARQARAVSSDLVVFSTQDLVVSMIGENLLDIAEADTIKTAWAEHHRFRLKIGSFSELID